MPSRTATEVRYPAICRPNPATIPWNHCIHKSGRAHQNSAATAALRRARALVPSVGNELDRRQQLFARKAEQGPHSRVLQRGDSQAAADASEPTGPLQFGCRTGTRRRRRASPERAGPCCPSFPMQARSCSLIYRGSFPSPNSSVSFPRKRVIPLSRTRRNADQVPQTIQ